MSIIIRLLKKVSKLDFGVILVLSLLIILFGTFSIYLIEPENFPSLFDSFWWTMTTLTTVGYGDFFPTSVGGRWIGIFLFIFGIGIIGLLITKTVDSLATYSRLKKEGKLVYKQKEHYIYIGWSKKVEKAVYEVLANDKLAKIVLVNQLSHSPMEHGQVHFVQGDPTQNETLLKANILEARRVAIFTDTDIDDPGLADGKTLLIASAVESLSEEHRRSIHTIVEVREETHISKFKHIHVDDFILSDDSVSLLMAKATLQPGTTSIFRQLLSKRYGGDIYETHPLPHWKTYKDASLELFEKGAVLLAVNQDMMVAVNKDQPLSASDILYIVCDEPTYEQLKSQKALL
ncbi:ion channel [Bacillus litorisediminis]|uniref:ion channel n=1 Tax=Bacillus litorisediminis TaxID=2922713 RepID=UPI001FAE1B8E|nr:potassium channel family protein [Bacillus litorisediminis]